MENFASLYVNWLSMQERPRLLPAALVVSIMRHSDDHEHPLVDPHVSHLRHVPFRTIVKLWHSEQLVPS
jgi:hypothetical protein